MARYPEIPDHPEIAHALRTGFPRPYKSVKCTDCEQECYGDEKMYISDSEPVCSKCLRNRLLEDYDIDDLADVFDIKKTTAYDYLTETEDPD